MSRQEKTLKRLASSPRDFTWSELVTVMTSLGYRLDKGSGSRRKFVHGVSGTRINMHEPHPTGILKAYQVREIVAFLKSEKILP